LEKIHFLKKKIEDVEGQFKNQYSNRRDFIKILQFHDDLREEKIDLPFERNLHDLYTLIGETSNSPIGHHGHRRSDYHLAWEKMDQGFFLTLENKKAKKKFKVFNCPALFHPHVSRILPIFFDEMVKALGKLPSPL
jgi:hypothetical protein